MAGHFDLVVIAGDHLDISGHVDGRAQIVVVLKYLQRLHAKVRLIASSGNHDLNARNEAGEKIARWMGRVRDLGVPTDGDSVEIDDTLFTICPWWDGPGVRDEVGGQLARDAPKREGPLDLGLPRPARRLADQLERRAALRRRRAGALDRASSRPTWC